MTLWPQYRTELWRAGILQAPITQVINRKSIGSIPNTYPITWLPPQPDFCFLADPFGLWRDGHLYVFCEAYDYRTKRGVIRHYTYTYNRSGTAFDLVAQGEALKAAHHLSYPFVIEDAGEVYMLPEAHRSGKLTLYRARRFPDQWEPVCDLLQIPVIDPSVIFHGGKWWMFHALPGARPGAEMRDMTELHVAVADKLTGPWRAHAGNPVRVALDSARPGGTPFVDAGKLYLPTQNCDGGYGLGVTLLEVETLSETHFAARPVSALTADDLKVEGEGLHTLAGCGPVTLVDVKRIDTSPRRGLINIERRLRRLLSI